MGSANLFREDLKMRETGVLLRLASIWLPILFAGSGWVVSSSEVQKYLPLAEGREWSYEVTKTRKYVLPDREMTQRVTGTSTERCERSEGVVDAQVPVFVVNQKLSETNETTGKATTATIQSYLSSEQDQILMHAQRIQGAPVLKSELEEFVPPVAVLKLPLPGPGEPYPSVLKSQGLTIDLRPFESGTETVETAAGSFQDCLQIRSRGPLSGSLSGPPQVPVSEGSIEETSWFAKGVGLVKQVQVIRMTVKFPDGREVQTTEEKTKLLTSYK
jgi:hypothetical protein